MIKFLQWLCFHPKTSAGVKVSGPHYQWHQECVWCNKIIYSKMKDVPEEGSLS